MALVIKDRRLKTGSFANKVIGSFGVKAGGMALTFLLQVYLARLLGAEQYGFYVYVLTCLNLLLFVGLWGWSSSTVKFVSVYSSKEQWALLRGVLQVSAWVPFASSLLVSIALVAVVHIIRGQMAPGLFEVFLVGVFLLPFNALLSTLAAATQGFKRAALAQLPQAIYRPILLMASVAAVSVYWGKPLLATDAMILNLVGAVLIAGIAWRQLRSSTPKEAGRVAAQYRITEWSGTAWPMLLFSGFVLLMKQFDIVMLGILATPTEAGIYSVATRIAELTTFGLMAINLVAGPLIAEHYAQENRVELQNTASKAALGVLAFTLPVAVVSIVFGPQILVLFGAEFSAGYNSLVILVSAQIVNGLAGSVGLLMTMTGHHKQAAIIMGGGAILNVAANLLLIPRYGMVGAAWATAGSMVFWNLAMLIKVRKTLGISSTVFSLLRN